MSEFGTELRRLRTGAGLSLSALATRIHYSKSQLSKVENGHARANREFAEACDTAPQDPADHPFGVTCGDFH